MNRQHLVATVAWGSILGPWIIWPLGIYVFPREWIWFFVIVGALPMILMVVVPCAKIAAAAAPEEFALACAGLGFLGLLFVRDFLGMPITIGMLIALRLLGRTIQHFLPDL